MSTTASKRSAPATKASKGDPGDEPFDERLAKAMAHPLRQRILQVLDRRVTSPREVAEELGEKLGDVGYHFRMLREYGVIELVRTEQRRGAVKHFYRATSRAMLDNATWARLPQSARRSMQGHALDTIWQHVTEAVEHHGFEREEAHVSLTTFDLDEKGYRAMVKLVESTVEKARSIQAQVVERRNDGKLVGEEVKTELAVMHFLPGGERDAKR